MAVLCLALINQAFSQSALDSLRIPGETKAGSFINKVDSTGSRINNYGLRSLHASYDSLAGNAINTIDSLRAQFQSTVDSLQLAYQSPLNSLDSASNHIRHQIDSLQSIKLPTGKFIHKLDSLSKIQSAKLTDLNQNVDQAKSRAAERLNRIKVPPEMQESVGKLSQSIKGFSIPVTNGKIPGLELNSARIPSFDLTQSKLVAPSLGNTQVPGLKDIGTNNQLGGITNQTRELSNVTGQVSGYGKDLQNVSRGKLDEVKGLDKNAEKKVESMAGGELKARSGEMEIYKNQLGSRPDSAAFINAKQEGIKLATNHFAGQDAVLKEAMGKMARLKLKYAEVKSMADLPRKLPNPLHDTPFRERLIPGVTFQIQNQQYFLLDVNVGALYRITPRFSAGAGWNQRITFDNWSIKNGESVYGPRGALQFNWKKGINFRLLPEVMNSNVPIMSSSGSATDGSQRGWVWGMFAGIKTDFRISKMVRGNTEALMNILDQGYKSPYQNQFVVRFGFEFPMRKKAGGF